MSRSLSVNQEGRDPNDWLSGIRYGVRGSNSKRLQSLEPSATPKVTPDDKKVSTKVRPKVLQKNRTKSLGKEEYHQPEVGKGDSFRFSQEAYLQSSKQIDLQSSKQNDLRSSKEDDHQSDSMDLDQEITNMVNFAFLSPSSSSHNGKIKCMSVYFAKKYLYNLCKK